MTLQRVEVNLTTGESKIINFTPQEESDAWASSAAVKPDVKKDAVADLKSALISKGVL